ncbi:hypothetical protein DBV15_12085 [Temnothorax longispinosus]|uniref:DDE Tnp4 domain-containing protein n=1 Tax=Temnothorax longispinosus TaxID=300112 RepID=A0A4S2JVI0_9HYME|nr:hypothetical protein DBV15_12085 [Temnothorax longispinosus]
MDGDGGRSIGRCSTMIDPETELLLLILLLNCEFVNLLCAVYATVTRQVLRRWWVRPINRRRDELGFHSNLVSEIMLSDHEEFFSYSRMWPEQFNILLSLVRPLLLKRSRRRALSPKLKLAATLAFLAHGDSIKSKAWEFRIGSMSDGGVWNNSAFADALEHGKQNFLLLKCCIQFPHVFVADEAFPLKSYLMRPYPRAALQDKQRTLPCSTSYREHFRHSRILMAHSQEVHMQPPSQFTNHVSSLDLPA